MRITNRPGLSDCWVAAVKKDEHSHMGDRSMTECLQPVRIYQLKKRHWDNLVEDVSERIWSLLGDAAHVVLERASTSDAITEQRFNVDVAGFKMSVCPDRVEKLPIEKCRKYWNDSITEPTFACGHFEYPTGTQLYALRDFKISQVYARNMLIKGSKGEWRWQVNGYAWALRKTGFPVVEASIEILMKDWDWMEANIKKTYDYPPFQAESIPIDLFNDEEVEAFLTARITEHMQTDALPDDELPFCTEEERWATRDRYAVKKAGGDKAMSGGANLDSPGEAEDFITQAIFKAANKKKPEVLVRAEFEVEFRKGESKRCERYCPCRSVCNQYLLMNPAF